MPPFKDAIGREWSLTLNVAQVRRVRERANLNLADPQIGDTLDKLRDDPVALIDAVFICVEPEAVKVGVNAEQFSTGFWGDAINDARAALWEALLTFFPSDKRAVMRALMTQVIAHETAVAEAANQIGTRSSESPENSESTPTPGAPAT